MRGFGTSRTDVSAVVDGAGAANLALEVDANGASIDVEKGTVDALG